MYSGTLKLTHFTGTCQNTLRRRWIRKLNKLTKTKPNPHGTPVTNKLYLFNFCCVQNLETHCGRTSQNI